MAATIAGLGSQQAAKAHSCPKCGTQVSLDREVLDAQRKIAELEAQIELLKEKATAAVDKCADYEDQLQCLRPTDSLSANGSAEESPRPSTANSASARASRFSFLTGRRGSPAAAHSAPVPPTPTDPELLEQLAQERALRAKAEEKARKVDAEIEELSVQLFSQANEMVAEERKARAKLEARIEQLEKKDKDKMARLDRLEQAVSRIDRVKAMLATPSPTPAPTASLSPPTRRN